MSEKKQLIAHFTVPSYSPSAGELYNIYKAKALRDLGAEVAEYVFKKKAVVEIKEEARKEGSLSRYIYYANITLMR